MREWIKPDIRTVDIEDTGHNGEVSMNFDNSFYDGSGALHVTFASQNES